VERRRRDIVSMPSNVATAWVFLPGKKRKKKEEMYLLILWYMV